MQRKRTTVDKEPSEHTDEEGASCNISEYISDDLIGKRDDDREIDPCSNPEAAATIDPKNSKMNTENMSQTEKSVELEPVEVKEMHCPITEEQKRFKEGVMLPRLFDLRHERKM